MELYDKVAYGTLQEQILIYDSGIKYFVDVMHGHKTGFFLDHRENRKAMRPFFAKKDVLDVFCGDGGFSLTAAHSGAKSVIAQQENEEKYHLLQELRQLLQELRHIMQELRQLLQELRHFLQELRHFLQELRHFLQELRHFLQELRHFLQELRHFLQELRHFLQELRHFLQELRHFLQEL
ncbi:hypothetical protein CHS0354_000765 [Potamilus streckersoni]|uniref:Uncharacterized protein n=1 Tax=Potamilus streckersoni TaxID=2493646 RepID=A0AAE0W7L7_9BIVA|nr:hypothetical protein CHS0354_000765 [Potamilus streckersoni]